MIGDTAGIEFRGHLSRIQRQTIALLPRYCLSDKLLKQIRNLDSEAVSEEDHTLRTHIQLAIEEVASNIVCFCRNLVSQSGKISAMFCFNMTEEMPYMDPLPAHPQFELAEFHSPPST